VARSWSLERRRDHKREGPIRGVGEGEQDKRTVNAHHPAARQGSRAGARARGLPPTSHELSSLPGVSTACGAGRDAIAAKRPAAAPVVAADVARADAAASDRRGTLSGTPRAQVIVNNGGRASSGAAGTLDSAEQLRAHRP